MSKRQPNVADDLLLNKVVLRPDRRHSRFPEMLGRPFESFITPSPVNGISISGWYFAADAPCPSLALLSPSNRGTKAGALDHAAILLEIGCSVLLYDYQGFGDSAGLADVRTLTSDAHAALSWATARGIWSPEQPLILMGLSLGTLVSTGLTASGQYAARAMILDGATEPYRALRRSFGPLGAVVAEVACSQIPDELNTQKQIETVACPILFVHGRNDSISTLDDLEFLAGRTKHPTLWILDDCEHLDIISKHGDEYREQLRLFLDRSSVR